MDQEDVLDEHHSHSLDIAHYDEEPKVTAVVRKEINQEHSKLDLEVLWETIGYKSLENVHRCLKDHSSSHDLGILKVDEEEEESNDLRYSEHLRHLWDIVLGYVNTQTLVGLNGVLIQFLLPFMPGLCEFEHAYNRLCNQGKESLHVQLSAQIVKVFFDQSWFPQDFKGKNPAYQLLALARRFC